MKKKYFDLEADIIFFETQDVVTLSNPIDNDDNDVAGDDPYGDF